MPRVELDLKIEGWNEIQRKLAQLDEAMRTKIMQDALLAAAEPVRQEASNRAPRRTGFLASRIITEVDGDTVRVGPHKDAFYGLFHEIGTSKMPARPFLRPAAETRRDDASRAAAEALRRGIEEVMR